MSTSSSASAALAPAGGLRRPVTDWLFAVLTLALGAWGFAAYGSAMDGYEKAILAAAVPSVIAMGWFWRPLRLLLVLVGLATWGAMALYQQHTDAHGADLAYADQVFWLKYFLSSQSAIFPA